ECWSGGRQRGRRSVFKLGVVWYFPSFSPGRKNLPNDNYFGTEGVLLRSEV
uniref:Uncharacterized protein n=1 Tax=Aegilops tauschii subsp. strangulata TaxID=200361 RepID=A0A453BE56_AEGTS